MRNSPLRAFASPVKHTHAHPHTEQQDFEAKRNVATNKRDYSRRQRNIGKPPKKETEE